MIPIRKKYDNMITGTRYATRKDKRWVDGWMLIVDGGKTKGFVDRRRSILFKFLVNFFLIYTRMPGAARVMYQVPNCSPRCLILVWRMACGQVGKWEESFRRNRNIANVQEVLVAGSHVSHTRWPIHLTPLWTLILVHDTCIFAYLVLSFGWCCSTARPIVTWY